MQRKTVFSQNKQGASVEWISPRRRFCRWRINSANESTNIDWNIKKKRNLIGEMVQSSQLWRNLKKKPVTLLLSLCTDSLIKLLRLETCAYRLRINMGVSHKAYWWEMRLSERLIPLAASWLLAGELFWQNSIFLMRIQYAVRNFGRNKAYKQGFMAPWHKIMKAEINIKTPLLRRAKFKWESSSKLNESWYSQVGKWHI